MHVLGGVSDHNGYGDEVRCTEVLGAGIRGTQTTAVRCDILPEQQGQQTKLRPDVKLETSRIESKTQNPGTEICRVFPEMPTRALVRGSRTALHAGNLLGCFILASNNIDDR